MCGSSPTNLPASAPVPGLSRFCACSKGKVGHSLDTQRDVPTQASEHKHLLDIPFPKRSPAPAV